MKKTVLILLLTALSINGAEQRLYQSFKIQNDCNPMHFSILFSQWGNDPDADDTIKKNGIRMSREVKQIKLGEILNGHAIPVVKPTPTGRPRFAPRNRPAPEPASEKPLILENYFPFRIFVALQNTTFSHSFVVTNVPNLPNTIYMSLDEANNPETILHFTCGTVPAEISDWNFYVESSSKTRIETHKAARQMKITPMTLEEQKKAAEETELIPQKVSTNVRSIITDFLTGELTPEDRKQMEAELKVEAEKE